MFVKVCDRCKKSIEKQKYQRLSGKEIDSLNREEIQKLTQSLDLIYGNQTLAQVDLCEDCKISFFEWLDKYIKK